MTEISHVLIQVWIFLRVWDPTILFLWPVWIKGTFLQSPEKSAGFSMEWEPHMECCAGGSITARSNPGEQETPFPYCFQEGCVFFLLDFLLTLSLFFSSLCPTVTNVVDLMLRVKFHLAWSAVGFFANLLLFRWKPEHNIKWEIPFIPSVTLLLGNYVKSLSLKKFHFAFWRPHSMLPKLLH